MLFDNILIISDLDGTMLNSDSFIDEGNVEAIKYFQQNGGRVTIASGRSRKEMLKVLKGKITPDLPIVSFNGAAVVSAGDDEKVFYIKPIGEFAKALAKKVSEQFDFVAVECYGFKSEYIINPNESTAVHNEIVEFNPIVVNGIDELPDEIVKISLWCNPNRIEELTKFLDAECDGFDVAYARSHMWCCDVQEENTNKGTALNALREQFSDIKTVVAVGDHDNDIHLLKNADYSFAVSGATEGVKNAATCVLDSSNDESPMLEVVRRIEEMIKKGII